MQEEQTKISESVYEIAIGALQAQLKRMFVLCVILIIALVGTNLGWFIYEQQFEEIVTETIEASSDSGDAYGTIVSGDDSEVNYGIKGKGDEN